MWFRDRDKVKEKRMRLETEKDKLRARKSLVKEYTNKLNSLQKSALADGDYGRAFEIAQEFKKELLNKYFHESENKKILKDTVEMTINHNYNK